MRSHGCLPIHRRGAPAGAGPAAPALLPAPVVSPRPHAPRTRLGVGLAAVTFLLASPFSHPATVVVTNLADAGPGTLREAIVLAEPGDEIRLDVRGSILLTSGSLVFGGTNTITGPGARDLTVDGGNTDRVWDILPGADLAITGVALRHGAPPGDPLGGGIANHGSLRLTDCAVLACRAQTGGGIFNRGTLAMTRCTIAGNTAVSGAGILNATDALLTLVNCTLSDNTNALLGAALFNLRGATSVLNHCTIARNFSTSTNGAAAECETGGTLVGGNSLLSDHRTPADPDAAAATGIDLRGPFQSQDFNLIRTPVFSPLTGSSTNSLFGRGATADLRPLADYGGPTDTHALGYLSDALDAGSPDASPTTDQRGHPRSRFSGRMPDSLPGLPRADIGAVEFQPLDIQSPALQGTLEDAPPARVPFRLLFGDFDVTPAGTPIRLTASVSDTTLIPAPPGPVFEGPQPITDPSATNHTLVVSSAPDRFGSTPVHIVAHAVFASDGVETLVKAGSHTFVLVVTNVNDRPTLISPANVTVFEDSGTSRVGLTGISAGPFESQNLSLTALATHPALRPDPEVTYASPNPEGSLSLTTATNANGTGLVLVVARDDGGTEYGGLDGVTNVIAVAVVPVNDPPSFVPGPDLVFPEAAEVSPTHEVGWAVDIVAGPPDESVQTLTFDVIADSPSLFSTPPRLSPTGVLSFTPAPFASGSTTLTITLRDDGGTLNGGLDASPPVHTTLTLLPVNNPPTLDPIGALEILEDSPATTVRLTGISAGPRELQQLTVSATSADLELMEAPGVVYDSPGPTATLTLVPRPDAFGTNMITVVIRDDGGTERGGVDALTNVVPVVILPVNDAPTFLAGPDLQTSDEAGPQRVVSWAREARAGPANESDQALRFLVDTDDPDLFTQAPDIDADGTLTFTPALGTNGATRVQVTLQDSGDTAHDGSRTSVPASFNLHIIGYPRPSPHAFLPPLDVLEGSTVHWIAATDGTPPLRFLWFFEGEPLGGETNVVLELTNVRRPRSGQYTLLVTNLFGSFVTNAQLTVQPATNPPRITARRASVQPPAATEPQAADPDLVGFPTGSRVTLEATATGSEQLFIQWRLNGVNLTNRSALPAEFADRGPISGVQAHTPGQSSQSGTLTSTLVLDLARAADAGRYTAVVANGRGAVESAPFDLRLLHDPPPGGLTQWFRDDFRDALTIPPELAASGTLPGNNRGFTAEAGEPGHPDRVPPGALSGATNIASGWLRWSAPADGVARFATAGSGIDTLLAVFTNRLEGASEITGIGRVVFDDDRADFGSSLVRFTAHRGQVFHLYLDGYAGATGDLSLSWEFEEGAPPVPVILVEPVSQRALAGQPEPVRFEVTAANLPYRDPPPGADCPDGPLTYAWRYQPDPATPAEDVGSGDAEGTLLLGGGASLPGLRVGLYSVTISNTCGQAVHSVPALLEVVQVDTDADAASALSALSLSETRWQDLTPVTIDPVPGRLALQRPGKHVGASVAAGVLTSNLRSKRQPSDPQPCQVIGGSARWFLLQISTNAAAEGLFELNTMGSSVDTLLAVYSLDAAGALQLVACDDNSAPDGSDDALVRFVTRAGAAYIVALDTRDGVQGLLQLHASGAPVPLQDALLWVRIPGIGDPVLDRWREGTSDPGGDGLIDADGMVSVETSTNIQRLFFAYSGADYPFLREIATENPDRCSGQLTNLVFNVNRGTAYLLAVLATGADVESVQPRLRFLPPRLELSRTPEALVLTWEGPYLLQSAATLDPPVPGRSPPWTDVVTGGLGINTVTHTLASPQAFFRLLRGERMVLGYTGCLPVSQPAAGLEAP